MTVAACTFDTTEPANLAAAQLALNLAIAAWVNTNQTNIAASGGCSPVVTNDFTTQSIDICTGGSVTITWTVTDLCQTSTAQAIYTVTPPPALTFIPPAPVTVAACTFDTTEPANLPAAQLALNLAIADWVTPTRPTSQPPVAAHRWSPMTLQPNPSISVPEDPSP